MARLVDDTKVQMPDTLGQSRSSDRLLARQVGFSRAVGASPVWAAFRQRRLACFRK
jgi:hypothetical protein